MTETAATGTVEILSLFLSLSIVVIFIGAMSLFSAWGVIKMHRYVIACLNDRVDVERRQKKYWRKQYYKVKREEVKRGERTDT